MMATARAGRRRRAVRVAHRRVRSSILITPVILYALVWMTALLLVSSGWLVFMTEVKPEFKLLVAGNLAAAVVAYFFARALTSRPSGGKTGTIRPLSLVSLRRFCDVLFGVWVAGSIINVIASGGLPIIWALRGEIHRSYVDFGIPTFTGLISACGLFATLGFFLLNVQGWNKRRRLAIVLVFLYQVAILSRGGAVWMLLQVIGVYLQVGRVGLRRIIGAVALIAALIGFFGLMGDVRARGRGDQLLEALTTPRGEALFSQLPSGVWWAYLYASVGPVNLNAGIDRNEPLGYPRWSVASLFPTVIRSRIYTEQVYEARYPLEMVNPAFNVFTLYGGYFADFGLAGCFAITVILHLFAGHYYVKARTGDVASIIAYAVCFQVIVLSLFTDSLTSWVTLFQFVLAFGLRLYERQVTRTIAGAERKQMAEDRPKHAHPFPVQRWRTE